MYCRFISGIGRLNTKSSVDLPSHRSSSRLSMQKLMHGTLVFVRTMKKKRSDGREERIKKMTKMKMDTK